VNGRNDVADVERCRRALESLIGVPVTDGNRFTVLRNGNEIFPAMFDAIRSAEHSIDFLTYVYWTGGPAKQMATALAERARAGVDVRVLLDAVGARLMDDDLADELRDAGAKVELFRPVSDWKVWRSTHRTHRRVLLVDGQVGFTGGVGISEEWEGDARDETEWRETHLRVDGPAVAGLRAAFLENWAEVQDRLIRDDERYPDLSADGGSPAMVVRSSAGHGVSTMSILKRLLIDLAEERVRITTAYLAPDEGALAAIADACERGVEVELLVPGEHIDKRVAELAARDHFEDLMDLGVAIYTYDRSMLHAKTMTIDGVVADIGSANFNSRSLSQDEELDVVVFDPAVAGELDRHFDDDLTVSRRITPDRWADRSALQKFAQGVVGLVDDVM
jgi:cardiolipin synthase A/B